MSDDLDAAAAARSVSARVRFARSYLANLYDEAEEVAKAPDAPAGAETVKMSLSDAIDALDRAMAASASARRDDA